MSVHAGYRGESFGGAGLVASAHPLATRAGALVLAEGGNAMDAVIAAASVTNVVLPGHCGIGGDAFLLYYEVTRDTVWAINSSGIAPRGAAPEAFAQRGYAAIPLAGILSTAVPGQVAAYELAHQRFGRLDPVRVFRDAVDLAADGFAVDADLAGWIAGEANKLSGDPGSAPIFFPCGRPLVEGDTLVQEDLADTLERVSRRGAEYFYRGAFAEAFYASAKDLGGLYVGDELAGHRAELYAPPAIAYRGYRVFSQRPVSQGIILLESLQLLNEFFAGEALPEDAEWIHLMIEIKKLAFSDRNAFLGDPTFVPFSFESLVAPEYVRRRAGEVRRERALLGPAAPGNPFGDTTYLCAVDGEGNACSFIHSLSHLFGSGVTVPGTGVLLNNRAGRGFTLEENHPNRIAPGKRTMHTLHSYLVRGEGAALWVGGTPGGDGQPQWNMQVLSHILDFGMNPSEAVAYPRWTSFPGTDPANLGRSMTLRIEDRFPGSTLDALRIKGHALEVGDAHSGGGAALLLGRPPFWARWQGGVDPRCGGDIAAV